MYPFGSGMPQPSPQQPQNNENTPFGSGRWVVPNQNSCNPQSSPYPHQSSPYPPQSNAYPPQSNAYPPQSSPYPPQSSPYPPQTSPYPPQTSPYPPQLSSYPPQSSPYPCEQSQSGNSHTPYPSQPQQHSYPPQVPYPGTGDSYPNTQNPTVVGGAFGSPYIPSSTSGNYPPTSQYPGQNNPTPYPQSHSYSANTTYGSAVNNMAQCFSEMRSHARSINEGTPTVFPAQNFDPVKDAHDLRKAMKGIGTDEDALINIICKRTNAQRQEIQRQFKTHFGKDLIEEVKSETSRNFQKLLVGLLHPIEEFYCMEICDAMSGIGTDEDVLIETLCTLSNSEIHTIKNTYIRMYGAHLESELKSETSGHFKRLLVSLCAGARDESGRTDPSAAVNDARELLNAGELRIGTDESMFNMVLCQRNYEQLKLVFKEYENLTGHSLEKAIKREFSGDIMEGLLAIYKCVTNKAEFFASRLHKSMAGFGTNDKQLIRIVITRCEIDMQDIKVAFERMYGKSLRSWIKGDTSGDYKHALYALIGESRSSP